jgi:hypothetical protein
MTRDDEHALPSVEGDVPSNRRRRHLRRRVAALLGALVATGAGGYEVGAIALAGNQGASAQVEQVVLHAINVDQNALNPPIATAGGLHLADYSGAYQRVVSSTTTPWQLCPGGGVTLGARGVQEMVTFNQAEVNRYFTGQQQQAELASMAQVLTGKSSATASDLSPSIGAWPCTANQRQNWHFFGPAPASVVQWNEVSVSALQASVSAIVDLGPQVCHVGRSAQPDGAHLVQSCSAPTTGPETCTAYLSRALQGTWRVDYLRWGPAPGAGGAP